jgi:crotonobetainyl-CoA:carnitine CoA-transferase CaiB-like acyl-CoA transferase
MAGPLEGVRVVDLTAVISGPICTQLLADQGADVIKVEPPGFGDLMRIAGTSRGGMSAVFVNVNRSKRSVVLNLRDPRGIELVKRLVRDADVFAQNFRPGAVERMGLGYDALREVRPDLIYLSITGFGTDGPYARKRVYDPLIQGISGMASVQRRPDSGEPDLVRNIVCDKVTGLTAAQAITAALFARERGRGGQHLRLAMLDAAVAFLWPDGMINETFLGEDVQVAPTLSDFYRVTPTADGFMTWFTLSDAEFQAMCRALDRPEWAEDPRFATLAARIENLIEAVDLLEEVFATWKTADLLAALEAEDVPCAPINAVGSVAQDPQVLHNALLCELDHPHAGRLRQPPPAVQFEATAAAISHPAPLLGEHSDEILREAGVSDTELAELREAGVVA